MAAHPAHNRSVRCAVSQSGRATYEISRRSSPAAITSATSITAKHPSLHSNIMRWHHDNPQRFKISAADRSWIQARLQRRGRDGRKHMRGAVSATFRRPAISSSLVKPSSVVPTSARQEELRTAFITLSGTGRLIAVDWPRAGLLLHDPQLETLPSARLLLESGFDQSSVGANRVQCPIAAGFLG